MALDILFVRSTGVSCDRGMGVGMCIGVMAVTLSLIFDMDGGNIGSWLGMRSYKTSLFPVTYEVLQALYRTHGAWLRVLRRRGSFRD